MKTKGKIIRIVLFWVAFFLVIAALQIPFRLKSDLIPETVLGFYEEEDDSLDAVYIGSSTTYAFWQATTAWENKGIAVYPFAVPSMPAQCLKYMIIEAQKTQKDPLFILNLNTFNTVEVSNVDVHRMADFLPMSLNKLRMMNMLIDDVGAKGVDRLEYYLPIIQFHEEWSNLKPNDIVRKYYNYKGAEHNKTHFSSVADISKWDKVIETTAPMTDVQKAVMDDLLQYIKENELKVLFVLVPNESKKAGDLEQLCTVAQYAENAGCPVLNLVNRKAELGMDTARDYYNEKHTNIHGALKFTGFLSEYLTENYSFEDKRGSEAYKSWDEAAKKWNKQAAPYLLDYEMNHEKRDPTMEARELSLKKLEGSILIRWNPIEGAETYHLYRKDTEKNDWALLAEFPAGTGEYTDEGLKSGVMYT